MRFLSVFFFVAGFLCLLTSNNANATTFNPKPTQEEIMGDSFMSGDFKMELGHYLRAVAASGDFLFSTEGDCSLEKMVRVAGENMSDHVKNIISKSQNDYISIDYVNKTFEYKCPTGNQN